MEIKSPMGGSVWKVEVKEGDHVEAGQVVAILESMKMEIPVEAEVDGTVRSIVANEGDFIQEGDTIVHIDQ
jgi:acetyl-CoA carboxylase biotin carboxyl carrier protein